LNRGYAKSSISTKYSNMSRYTFSAKSKEGKLLEVTIGWDPGLLGYFMTIQKATRTGARSAFVFNNLMQEDSHPKSLDFYLSVLVGLGIDIDTELVQHLNADAN
jgi:hypothetical protein